MASKVTLHQNVVDRIIEDAKAYQLTIADEVRDEAKALAPVDTGKLRDSIQVSNGDDTDTIYSDVPYARVIEYGTRATPAQPFFRPAVRNVGSRHSAS